MSQVSRSNLECPVRNLYPPGHHRFCRGDQLNAHARILTGPADKDLYPTINALVIDGVKVLYGIRCIDSSRKSWMQ